MRTIGLLADHASDEIPASHRDLVECPPVAALTTVMPDGYPQTSVVWCDFDGDCVRVNTMRGFAKERNMRRDPRVTLLCYDPREPLRYLEVRGTVVEMTEDGARPSTSTHSPRSTPAGRSATSATRIPARFAETEIPVLCRIRPTHVVALDATGARRRDMTSIRRARDGPDPGLPPRPADQADLRGTDDDRRRRPAPVEPGVGRL